MFESNLNVDDNYEIMMESKQTLRRVKSAKKNLKKDLFVEAVEAAKRYDSGSHFYEVYDSADFEAKSLVDMLYYKQLFNKIEENEQHISKIESLLTTLTRNVKNVYEITNLKPEIYGNNINTSILESSENESSSKIAKQIYEYFDQNFHKMNVKTRNEKYYNESVQISKKLIIEGLNTEEAIQYSIKCVVMEGLLRKIAFPFSIQSRINYLIESDIYQKVFDSQRLVESVDLVNKDIRKIASIISVVV